MKRALRVLALLMAIDCAAAAADEASVIDFEVPALSAVERLIVDPYVAGGISFSVEPGTGGDWRVGLVKNQVTSVCVDPLENQKLGVGRAVFAPGGSVGLSSAPIRATFPAPLTPPVVVSVDFQANTGTPLRLRLFDGSGRQIASTSAVLDLPGGSCGDLGASRGRKTVSVTSAEPVAYAVMDVDESTGSRVFVVDNFVGAGAVANGDALWPGDVAVTTGPGHQGVNASVPPAIALVPDGTGGAMITWEDLGALNVYVQHLDAAGIARWGPAGVPVAEGDGQRQAPRAVTDGMDGLIVAWAGEGNLNSASLVAQRIDGFGQRLWAARGVPVVSPPINHFSLVRMTSDGESGAIFVWVDNRQFCCRLLAQRLSANGDMLWGAEGTPVAASATGHSLAPAVIADGGGGGIVAWLDRSASPAPIRIQRLDHSGVPLWGPDGFVIGTPTTGTGFALASDGFGGALITWSTSAMGVVGDVRVQRVGIDGGLLWLAGGVTIATVMNQMFPNLIGDGAGGAIVVWEDRRVESNGADLYARRVGANGEVLWNAPVPVSRASEGQAAALIVGDGAGGAIVAWHDSRSSRPGGDVNPLDLYAQRLSATGQTLWQGNGRAVTTARENQGLGDYTVMISDGLGGAILAWPDGRNDYCGGGHFVGGCDVYAQRISDAFGSLSITFAGDGQGQVTARAPDIDCRSSCRAILPVDTVATLTAWAPTGSRFVAWTGCPSVEDQTCTVPIDAAHSVSATFERLALLVVGKRGAGSGAVTSHPAGIECGSNCREGYPRGTVVTLAAGPTEGSTFVGWRGCRSVLGRRCTVSVQTSPR